jgi:hypothetical protein
MLTANGLRVGDVALCCACGKVILLTRCYGVFYFYHFLTTLKYFNIYFIQEIVVYHSIFIKSLSYKYVNVAELFVPVNW